MGKEGIEKRPGLAKRVITGLTLVGTTAAGACITDGDYEQPTPGNTVATAGATSQTHADTEAVKGHETEQTDLYNDLLAEMADPDSNVRHLTEASREVANTILERLALEGKGKAAGLYYMDTKKEQRNTMSWVLDNSTYTVNVSQVGDGVYAVRITLIGESGVDQNGDVTPGNTTVSFLVKGEGGIRDFARIGDIAEAIKGPEAVALTLE